MDRGGRAAVTPVRIVCQNTARAALHLTDAYTAAFRIVGEQFLAQRFTPTRFDAMTSVRLPGHPARRPPPRA